MMTRETPWQERAVTGPVGGGVVGSEVAADTGAAGDGLPVGVRERRVQPDGGGGRQRGNDGVKPEKNTMKM